MPELNVIVVTPSGFHVQTIDQEHTGEEIKRIIGCRAFDAIELDDRHDMWVDDEYLLNGSPLNLAASILTHHHTTNTVVFGTAVIAGHDVEGATTSVADDLADSYRTLFQAGPTPGLVDVLATSLAPMPAAVARLRLTTSH